MHERALFRRCFFLTKIPLFFNHIVLKKNISKGHKIRFANLDYARAFPSSIRRLQGFLMRLRADLSIYLGIYLLTYVSS